MEEGDTADLDLGQGGRGEGRKGGESSVGQRCRGEEGTVAVHIPIWPAHRDGGGTDEGVGRRCRGEGGGCHRLWREEGHRGLLLPARGPWDVGALRPPPQKRLWEGGGVLCPSRCGKAEEEGSHGAGWA